MRLIGFSPRRSCHEVTDEVKSHDIMLFSVRHCVGRSALMPPNLAPPSRLRRATPLKWRRYAANRLLLEEKLSRSD